MSVFFRWGVFGILAVAALLYAYNASKSLAEKHQAKPAPAPVASLDAPGPDEQEAALGADTLADAADEGPVADDVMEMPAACEEERLVAERALKYRRDGEPFDLLLRMQTIVFQNDEKRRERLEAVARQWYEREGRDPDAATLRGEVLRDCLRFETAS
jgi:hypothetical protein